MNHPLDGEVIENVLLRGNEILEHLERTAA